MTTEPRLTLNDRILRDLHDEMLTVSQICQKNSVTKEYVGSFIRHHGIDREKFRRKHFLRKTIQLMEENIMDLQESIEYAKIELDALG